MVLAIIKLKLLKSNTKHDFDLQMQIKIYDINGTEKRFF